MFNIVLSQSVHVHWRSTNRFAADTMPMDTAAIFFYNAQSKDRVPSLRKHRHLERQGHKLRRCNANRNPGAAPRATRSSGLRNPDLRRGPFLCGASGPGGQAVRRVVGGTVG